MEGASFGLCGTSLPRKARAGDGLINFPAEKRAGVRDPRFRSLPPKIQEQLAGTNYDTLRRIYDEVTVEEMQEAMAAVQLGALAEII